MASVNIYSNYTTPEDIDSCIVEFKKMKQSNDKIFQIYFINDILEIDILFIAYLILFKNLEEKIEITLNFGQNQNENSDFEFKLKQYQVNAYLATGKQVFLIKHSKLINDWNLKITKSNVSFNKNTFVFSESFLPFISITKSFESYEDVFLKCLNDKNQSKLSLLKNDIEYKTSNEELYENIKRYFLSSSNPKDRFNCLHNLGQIAFYNCLRKFRVLNIYFDEGYNLNKVTSKKIQSGFLHGKDAYDLYEDIKPIIEELETMPLFQIFLFSIILSSFKFSNVLTSETEKNFKVYLLNLWNFSKNLFHGLKELAKNIHEHSSPTQGIIIVRIYEELILKNLKKTDQSVQDVLDYYTSSFQDNLPISFLEINVADLGSFGVINTLLNKSEELILPKNIITSVLESSSTSLVGNFFKNFISEDIELLRSGKIGFENFIDSSLGISLNQQYKRATAHLGLLVFSKLIEHNHGLLFASSWNSSEVNWSRDKVIIPSMYNNKGGKSFVNFGTNYSMILPVMILDEYKSHLPHKLDILLESSSSEIKGLEEIFNYKVFKIEQNTTLPSIHDSERYLCTYQPIISSINISHNEQTLFEEIFGVINSNLSFFNERTKYTFCLDLDHRIIDGSILFRLFGKWEFYFPKIPIIIYNFPTKNLLEVLEINQDFLMKVGLSSASRNITSNLDFWSENSIILSYSFVETGNERFYFTDALSGKYRNDFININKLIRRTNFNSITSFDEDIIDVNESYYNYSVIDIFSTANRHLIPFDLLLKSSDGMTLFEHSTLTLLNNELKTY